MKSEEIITLSNFLRNDGMNVSIRSTITASGFYEKYHEEFDKDQMKVALKCIYIKNKSDEDKFNKAYDKIFNKNKPKKKKLKQKTKNKEKPRNIAEIPETPSEAIQTELSYQQNMELIEERRQQKIVNDNITQDSLVMLDNYDNRIFDICQRLSKKIANQRNKRRKLAKSHNVNMPRTIRHNLKNGGHLINLLKQKPPLKKTKQIFLCDVSGSCQWVSTWFFAILYGCYKTFDKMQVYDFDNKAVDVTNTLKNDFKNTYEINSAHQALGVKSFGQSDMSKAFREFLKKANLNRNTDIIILSDCRDWKGKRIDGVLESAHLIHEMSNLARKVIILNPEKKIRWNTPTSCVKDYVNAGAKVYQTNTLDEFATVVSNL